MKKCKKCGCENSNSRMVCEKCYSFLGDEKSGETSETFFKKLERKEKIINLINYLLIALYFIIVTPLFILSARAMESLGAGIVIFFFLLILPIMFYMSIFHPDVLFELSYMHMISNIDDAQPSDWFYITTRWSAYLFLGLGIFIMVWLYCEVA